MTLTELVLDEEDTRKIVISNRGRLDGYTIHKLVYGLFEKIQGGRILYHDFPLKKNSRRILIFCDRPVRSNVEIGRIRTIQLNESFFSKDTYLFSVVVNPTKRLDGRKRLTITDTEEVKNWFVSKMSEKGVSVRKDSLEVGNFDFVRFRKGEGNYVRFGKTEVSGILDVSDRKKFMDLILSGIGKEKAFGCGMIRVVPVNR